MTSTFETGHVKNKANFDTAVSIAEGIGKDFQPSNDKINLPSLRSASAACNNAMNAVLSANAFYKVAVDVREEAFYPIGKLVSRIFNTMKASNVPQVTVQTAISIIRKLQGRRATPKRTEEEVKADTEAGISYKEKSSSQRSYDNIIENFSMLIELLLNAPGYKPNEKDLQTDSLKSLIAGLKEKNDAVIAAKNSLFDARTLRDELMYKKETGMVDLVMDVKSYIKGAFGPSSPQYKKIAGLKFKRA